MNGACEEGVQRGCLGPCTHSCLANSFFCVPCWKLAEHVPRSTIPFGLTSLMICVEKQQHNRRRSCSYLIALKSRKHQANQSLEMQTMTSSLASPARCVVIPFLHFDQSTPGACFLTLLSWLLLIEQERRFQQKQKEFLQHWQPVFLCDSY